MCENDELVFDARLSRNARGEPMLVVAGKAVFWKFVTLPLHDEIDPEFVWDECCFQLKKEFEKWKKKS